MAITTEVRLVLTEKDAGSSHTVRAREQISVSLTEIAGTAYYWEWQTPPQLVEKSNVFIPDNPGAAGTSGKRVVTFEAQKHGKGDLVFQEMTAGGQGPTGKQYAFHISVA